MTVSQNNMAWSRDKICPLCSHSGPFKRLVGPLRFEYHLCPNCQLIFMDQAHLPDQESEKAHYQTHQNGPQHAGYVEFLNQAISPTLPYLQPGMRGLDYGCGPGPTIHELLKNAGIQCDNYDPFFYPGDPMCCFDFIFTTEAAEHFFYPGQELNRIRDLIKPGGTFTLMTETWDDLSNFPDWYYAKDFTHVCFYHANTIDAICELYGFQALNRENPRVSVLKAETTLTSQGRIIQ